MKIGQKCLATDEYGNYHREPCVVIGFETNMLGMVLVRVRRTNIERHKRWGETVFYPHELQPED